LADKAFSTGVYANLYLCQKYGHFITVILVYNVK